MASPESLKRVETPRGLGVPILHRMASGTMTDADLSQLADIARSMLADRGMGPSLERRLRLPTTEKRWRDQQRLGWLMLAAEHLDFAESWEGLCRDLAESWVTFITRGPWRVWRDEEDPPEEAATLNRALFYATRESRGKALGARQLQNLLDRNALVQKFRANPRTVELCGESVAAIPERTYVDA